jgi:nitroreductase
MSTLDTDVFATRVAQANADEQFIRRWSPRAMNGKPLSLDELNQLFEAARWAPSCFNSQPWRFIYTVKGGRLFEEHLGLLMDMNQTWAQHAGALIAVVSKKTFEHNDNPAPTASFDTGSAWMSMALQAQHMGLAIHAMWGFHHEETPSTLNLTDDFQVEAMVAVGWPGAADDLPAPYSEREVPSPRKELADIVFEGTLT